MKGNKEWTHAKMGFLLLPRSAVHACVHRLSDDTEYTPLSLRMYVYTFSRCQTECGFA